MLEDEGVKSEQTRLNAQSAWQPPVEGAKSAAVNGAPQPHHEDHEKEYISSLEPTAI